MGILPTIFQVSLTTPMYGSPVEVIVGKTFNTVTINVSEGTYYESIDFNYESAISPILVPSFDDPVTRNWEDSISYRLGITQELETLTLMAGFVIDETPTPEATLGFESPGSDSMAISFGGRYKIDDSMDVGLGILYTMKEDRVVQSDSIDGEFTDSNALLISAGVGHKF